MLYSTSWLHVESVLKGGAYWNDALSRQIYQANGVGTEVSAYDSPSAAAFVGELGFTGVLPLTSHLDFRFGYLVFWLQGIAQPTRQLSLPVSTTGDPLVVQDGGTVVQGLHLDSKATGKHHGTTPNQNVTQYVTLFRLTR